MKLRDKEEAVFLMNQWGAEKRPFLFVIDYSRQHIYVETIEEIEPTEICYNFNGRTNVSEDLCSDLPATIQWDVFPQSIASYATSFDNVKRHILAGNSYLVNLTCSTPVATNLTLPQLFTHARAPYKLLVPDRFVVFSPEIFIRITDGFVYSYPMKGTIDAMLPDARSVILNDEKETAEHATIVDLIRNDLSYIATEVTVTRYRYIDEIWTNKGALLQVSSEIRGRLDDNWPSEIGTLLFQLLPAGSITGAPKKKTLEIIAESETYDRGFYTGVMGCFDGESLDSAVMIRFLEQSPDGSFEFKSGGGITARSEMEKEYNEMIQKVYAPISMR